MNNLVKLLIGRAVVRYLNGDMDEFLNLKSQALEAYAGGKCTVNRGPLVVTVEEIIQAKGAAAI